ncbi:SPOR domain-containing protein [Chromobacterium sp. IIBBL 290-4]|uniref:SPOR domain-containing protein n=1 Tax=Chromobacterium sp. IIBBL 290-4 TaxID=2953890 RepID=UPI0020B8886B|nr:SPOR domain-containing protein [Chromobacterium sp. IIBBL 290-4]UTH73247.1 SPOR domain-containing protein [Chromobacterium sp. IIBBL 290-4]
MALSSHDELILLRKRARRRLVGAVVLVSIATVVLWNVVGHLPEQQMKPESIEIMGAASAPASAASAPAAAHHAASQVVAAAPVASAQTTDLPANLSSITEPQDTAPASKPAPQAAAAQPKAEQPKPAKQEPKAEAKPEPKPKAKPESRPHQPDPAAILEGRADAEHRPAKTEQGHGKSVVQLAALSDPAKVDALRGKLASIGVSAHFSKVETSKGEVTRVRVGPFHSQAEAQQALQKLARAGITGIIINK